HRVRLQSVRLEERVQPATFVVSTLADGGAGSLREAIDKANKNNGADVIDLTGVNGTISLLTALPDVLDNVSFNGPGASKLTVRLDITAPSLRLLTLGGVVSMSGMTLANGDSTDGFGGAIYINGRLTINDCLLQNNVENGTGNRRGGGAIYVENNGQLTVNHS